MGEPKSPGGPYPSRHHLWNADQEDEPRALLSYFAIYQADSCALSMLTCVSEVEGTKEQENFGGAGTKRGKAKN